MKYTKPEIARMSTAIAGIQTQQGMGKFGLPTDNVPHIDQLTVSAYEADE